MTRDTQRSHGNQTDVGWKGRTKKQYVRRHAQDVGRKFDERKSVDGSSTEIRQKSDERRTKVGRKSDVLPTQANLRRTCRAQPPLQRWWAAALHCNDGRERCSSQHCCGADRQHVVACSVLVALLQQRAGPRNVAAMASNALDLATLLRWPTTRWTSQRCCDGQQRDVAATTHWTS
jgi:hypothetical protein